MLNRTNKKIAMRNKFLLVLLLACPGMSAANTINVGVRAHSGEKMAYSRWQPTIDYLNQTIPEYHFALHAVEKITEMDRLVGQGKLDFVITQPVAYIDLNRFHGVEAMLTLKSENGITQFGSVIFRMKRNKGINFMVDVPGHQIAAVDEKGFGGWLIAHNELLQNHVNLMKARQNIHFLNFHEAVVKAVMRGDADVGIVRTGILEAMQERGEIRLQDFYIINALVTPGFEQIHSTRLFPEWVVARARKVPLHIAEQVAEKLLALDDSSEAVKVGKYGGWTVPLDYSSVATLMKNLKVGSFEQPVKISHLEYLLQHRVLVILILSLLILLLVHYFRLWAKNHRLQNATRKHSEDIKKLEYMAGHDALTQLPNRSLAMELLAKELQRARRNQSKLALMFIDLDGFKGVNDMLGHAIGDEVLKEVADAIKAVVRESDIVGRFGGDEFIVSINDISSEKDIDEIASKLNRTVGNVRALDNTGQKIQASIGVIVSTVKQSSPESLIKLADKMMYKAKSAGKGCYKILEV